jgi:hypothetical protein
MPAAADMTLADAGATGRLFKLLSPSAGLNANAEWAYQVGAIVGVYPRITSQARVNAQGKSRVSQHKIKVPYAIVDTTTSTTKPGSSMEFNITVSVPDDFPAAARPDAVAWAKNYMANAITMAVMQDGIPAT